MFHHDALQPRARNAASSSSNNKTRTLSLSLCAAVCRPHRASLHRSRATHHSFHLDHRDINASFARVRGNHCRAPSARITSRARAQRHRCTGAYLCDAAPPQHLCARDSRGSRQQHRINIRRRASSSLCCALGLNIFHKDARRIVCTQQTHLRLAITRSLGILSSGTSRGHRRFRRTSRHHLRDTLPSTRASSSFACA